MRHLPVPRQDRYPARPQDVQYVVRPDPERSREPGLREYVNILRRRKWLVLAPLALALPLLALYLVLTPPVYEATATLLIESVDPKLLATRVGITLEQSENFYRTQYELIQSRAVAEQVVDTLDLQENLPGADQSLLRRVRRAAVRRLKHALGLGTGSQTSPASTPAEGSAREQAIARLQQTFNNAGQGHFARVQRTAKPRLSQYR